MEELQAHIACRQLKGLSTKKFLEYYRHYGSAVAVYKKAKPEEPFCPLAEKEVALAREHGIEIVPITSDKYPQALKLLPDAPLVLYIKGTLPPEATPKVAIVGTRTATEWGKECTYRFAKSLSSYGLFVISGLARGIDTSAHKGAIESTVAIVGSGLLHLYPKENVELAQKICQKGALVSELLLEAPPTRYSFPRRNRLIAALSDALLLTEAPLKSGAMITMQMGESQKKPLFCLPGRAMNDNYAGNHSLIKEGKAKLVESPEELASFLNIRVKDQIISTTPRVDFLEKNEKILDLLCQSDLSIDELSRFICLPVSQLQVILTKLILNNLAVELPGKRYKGTKGTWQSH